MAHVSLQQVRTRALCSGIPGNLHCSWNRSYSKALHAQHLIVVADQHQGGTAPVAEHAEHRVQRLNRQAAARVPEVACDAFIQSCGGGVERQKASTVVTEVEQKMRVRAWDAHAPVRDAVA